MKFDLLTTARRVHSAVERKAVEVVTITTAALALADRTITQFEHQVDNLTKEEKLEAVAKEADKHLGEHGHYWRKYDYSPSVVNEAYAGLMDGSLFADF